jgi:hypothetical protein
VQEQILVPRTLLDPRVRFGLNLEELLGSQPAADEVSDHNEVNFFCGFRRLLFSYLIYEVHESCSCQGGHTLLEDD